MIISTILLMTSKCLMDLLTALAFCIIPALLGLLAARSFFKVDDLREKSARLEGEVNTLTASNTKLTGELTDTRMKVAQHEADLETKVAQISRLRNDVIIAESDRNVIKGKFEEYRALYPAVAAAAAAGAIAVAAGTKPAAKAATGTFDFFGKRYKQDDHKIVEGIGPKIDELLRNADILTWKQLSETSAERLREILDAAGPNYTIHEPATWSEQARLADAGEWDALKALQDKLDGGREVK